MALTEEEKRARQKKYRHKYYLKNKASEAAKQKIYYQENKEAIVAYKLQWSKDNKDKRRSYSAKWKKANKEDYLKSTRRRRLKARKEMSDNYIKQVIIARTCMKYKHIPQSLIQAKRAELKLKRLMKE